MDSLEYTAPQYAETDAKKAYRTVGAALLAFIAATHIASIALAYVVRSFFPSLLSTSWFSVILNFVLIYCIGAPLFLIIIKKTPAIPREKKRMSAGSFICSSFMVVSCIYVFNIITIVIITAIEYALDITVPNRLATSLVNSNFALTVVSNVIVAPVLEELIFRKMLCDRLAPYGERQAVFFSALAFSLFHANLQQMLYAFALGYIFGVIYVRTGKIIYPIILHGIVNLVGSVPGLLVLKHDVSGVLERFSLISESGDTAALIEYFAQNAHIIIPYLLYSFFLLFSVLAGTVLGLVFLKKLIRATDGSKMPRKKRIFIMFSDEYIALYVVFALTLTVYGLIKELL